MLSMTMPGACDGAWHDAALVVREKVASGSAAAGELAAVRDILDAARAVFAEVDDALGQDLTRLIFEGPEDQLTMTANAQPALMAVSVAMMRVLEKEAGIDLKTHVACVAGHSLGEYSALAAAGIAGDGAPKAVAAGDGSEGAYQRIRAGQYQSVTVAEPLNLQGWQLVDELNRAMHGEPASGYMSPLHVVTKANIDFDGGDKNMFDPGNGYRDAYAKIWGK